MTSSHLLFLITLLLQLLFSCYAGNSTALSQCSTLIDFKKSFTNSSSKLDTWLRSTDCCSWDGITCDPLSGMVIGIDLGGCYMAGKIRPTLFNLTSLQKLNLAYNLFNYSPIPDGFELLPNLTSLNLSYAGFSGQIPIGIAKLTNLVSLDLSTPDLFFTAIRTSIIYSSTNLQTYIDTIDALQQNELELINPDFKTLIGNMSNLRELYLDSVDIASAGGYQWSTAVAKLTPKLTALSLVDCSITGPIHSSFGSLHNLSIIRLDDNELNSSVPEFFGNFSSLREITLSDCGLNGVFPKSVFLLRNLKNVVLMDNEMLSVSLPDFPDESNNLELLILSSTNFSGSLLNIIGKLQYLTALELSDCHLSGVVPSSLSNLSQLVILDLSDNLLSGAIPSSIQKFRHLKVLDMDQNLLQGEIPGSLFQLLGLQYLSLASNNLSGKVKLNQFSIFRNLSLLDLSYSNISIHDSELVDSFSFPQFLILALASCNLKNIPSFLRYQNQVTYLDLSNNKITGEVPNWIWSIGNYSLFYLNLSFNYFTSLEGPLPNLSSRSQYVTLDLHSNLLAGPILLPQTTFMLLDYSNNNFSSSLPSNISSYISSAYFLSFANNYIMGEIPPSICNTSYLEILDLSNNDLSGLIPPCLLEGISSLRVLNLGGNQLQGTIPQNISVGCGLQTLNLNDNDLEGRLPQSLANCNVLEFLDLGNNHINGPIPFWLGKIHSLRVLVLRSNKLYGPVEPPPGISATNYLFPKLQIFDISSNNLSGSLPAELLKYLKAMMVNSVSNRSSIGFKDDGSSPSYYQVSVTVIFKGSEMNLVSTVMKLFTSIDFSYNGFTGNVPDIIGELKSLMVLNFSHNELNGNIPPSIGHLVQLESLDLSSNKLSGKIPPGLSNLTFLSSLDLSNNKLVGQIPQGNQLSTFSNTSFQGNEGLCGIPLTKRCNNPILISTRQEKSVHSPSTYVIGLALSIGVGFGVGYAVVIVLQNVSWKLWKRQDAGQS